MKNIKKVSTLAAVIIIGSLAGGANGAVTVYTDFTAWSNDVTGIVTDELFDVVEDSKDITFNTGLTSKAIGTQGVHDASISAPFGGFAGSVSTDPTKGYSEIIWIFPTLVSSFIVAIDTVPDRSNIFGGDLTIKGAFEGGDINLSSFLTRSGDFVSGFSYSGRIGVISDSSFDKISFSSSDVTFSSHNVTFNTVPEPSSATLWSLGCFGLLMKRSRA